MESGGVALKSAEKKTNLALKEMAKISNIIKARKVRGEKHRKYCTFFVFFFFESSLRMPLGKKFNRKSRDKQKNS